MFIRRAHSKKPATLLKAFFLSLLLLTMLLTTAETPEASSLKLPAPRQLYVRGEVAPPSAPVPLRLVEVVESKPIKFPAEDEPIKVVAKAEPLGAAAEAEPIKPSSDAWPVKVAAEAELIKAAVKEEPIKVAAKEAPGKAESKVGPVKEAVQPPPHPFRNRNLRDRTTGSRAAQTKNVQKKAVTKRAAAASKRSTSSNIRRAKKGTAILNFSDAMIKNVIMTISEITGNNYILSPEVINRKISIRTTKPIKKGDISGIFDTILAVNGLASVKTGDYYTIVPAKSAIQSNIRLYTGSDPRNIPGGDAMINLLVPIEFISALDVLEIIKPSLSAGGNIAHYPLANTLIITDTASKVKKFLALIDEIDIDLFEKLNVSLVHINNVDVKTLSQELIDIFDVLGYEKKSHQFSAVPLERFNSIILFSSNKKLMASARKWIEELDKNSSSDEITTHIYYVQNDKASNIRGVLTEIYGGQTKEDTNRDTVQGPAAADAAAAPDKKKRNKKTALDKAADGTEASAAKSGSIENLEIFIYEPSNAIIIRASERDYQSLLSTIRELDRAPKQVLIDAMVVEVALDESLKYGIQWSAISGNVSTQSNTGIFSNTIDDPLSAVSTPVGAVASAGLNILATDAKNFFAFLQAQSSDGKVNVLSNPHILVQNYAKASITVGRDEPIATQSTQNSVTTTASIIQSIEYRKTGIVLTVSPQITETGMVAMTLRQEISDVSTSRIVGDGSFPSFTSREAETSVVIKNGETIAIGGLIDTKKNRTHSAVPVVSRIPLLGNLFKHTTISEDRTELIILLTPRVIANSEEAHNATDALRSKLGTMRMLMEKESAKDAHSEER